VEELRLDFFAIGATFYGDSLLENLPHLLGVVGQPVFLLVFLYKMEFAVKNKGNNDNSFFLKLLVKKNLQAIVRFFDFFN